MSDHLPECMTPDDPCADPNSCDSLACAHERLHLTLRDEADQREGHLPECHHSTPDLLLSDFPVACICPELRACEQRVLSVAGPHNYSRGRKDGYAAGVQAAREAVAAQYRSKDNNTNYRDEDWDNAIDDALAAIDGLRDGPLTELSKKGWDHRG